jgi:hypothetical protein
MRGVLVHAGFVAALAGPETGVQPNVAVGRGAWGMSEPKGVVHPLMAEKSPELRHRRLVGKSCLCLRQPI